MINKADYKGNRNSFYNLHYKLHVNIYKNKKILYGDISLKLKDIANNIFIKHNNCIIENIKFIDKTTIEIQFESTPNINLSKLISNFKTVSSRLIRHEFIETLTQYELESQFWESKYFIATR